MIVHFICVFGLTSPYVSILARVRVIYNALLYFILLNGNMAIVVAAAVHRQRYYIPSNQCLNGSAILSTHQITYFDLFVRCLLQHHIRNGWLLLRYTM